MATYRLTTEDGTFDVTTDDGDVQEPSLASKAWDSLKKPEELSRKGLGMITEAVSPSMEDIEAGKASVPGMAVRAGMEALTDVAPGFVSRGSILTAGALKGAQMAAPAIKATVKGLGSQLENASGVQVPGALNKAYNDVTQMFAKGRESAKPLYQAAKEEIPKGESLFSGSYKPEQILDKAQEFISGGGKLEPAESLTVRKAIDILLKSKRYVKDELLALRDFYDDIAKSSENIAMADPLHARAVTGESLRKILPQNATGGTSQLKTWLLGVTGGAAAPLLSPAVQGLAATGAGVVGRNAIAPLVKNPEAGLALRALMEQFLDKGQREKLESFMRKK